jgi:ParB-like chromosome segregation protein Spo0J
VAQTLTVESRPLADLRTHPANPRRGNVSIIAESLTVNGLYRPIVTTKDGTILAGNHTYLAAESLGWESLDCVLLDLEPDSDAAVRVMLADNRTADLGGYSDESLVELLESLGDDLTGTGYDEHYADALRHLIEPPDLDDLADLLGDPTEADSLVRVVLSLPKETAEALNAKIKATGLPAPDSHERLISDWLDA